MFKLRLAAAMMLLSLPGFSQHSVVGTVKDAKGHSLVGASVQIEGINRAAVTDEFGLFSISHLNDGEYSIAFRFIGYEAKKEQVTVSGSDVSLEITLDETATITDEVVVTATRAGDKTPIAYTNVGKEAIQKQNFGQDLPMLLNWTPSVVTTSDAGAGIGYTGIRIRGSDATRVNVTINGVPYNDSESQGTFWVDIPDIASSSQSIQIQRGVGTSTNGAGAFGASINLQTNTRTDNAHAEIMSSAGSFGTTRSTLSFGTGILHDKWVVDGRISKIHSDGFIDRAFSDLQSYYFSAGFYSGNTMIKAITFGGKERTYQAWFGVPRSRLTNDNDAMLTTASNEGWNEEQTNNLLNSDSRTFNPYTYKDQVDDYRQDHYQLHLSQRLSDAFTGNISLHYTPGKGYYEEYRYDNDLSDYGLQPVVIGDSVIESTDLIRRRWLDSDFYGFTYAFNYDADDWNVILGGGWNRYDCDHFGEIIWAEVSPVSSGYRYYFNNGDKRDFNTYLKITRTISEKLTGFVDLQYRRITYTTAGIENKQNVLDINANFDFFNPKAGLTYSIDGQRLVYASYSVGNREPVRDDFVDALQGIAPKAEKLHDIEAGYKANGKSYVLNANVYYMAYKNQLVLTGKVNDVGASVRTNVDKSYRLGLELEGAVHISGDLSWNANITVSKNKIKEFNEVIYDYGLNFDEYNEVTNTYKDTDISFSPDVIAGSGFTYQPGKHFAFTWLSKYVGKQYLDNTSNDDRSIDPYWVNDMRASYTARPAFMKEITVSLLANNIFSEMYESNGYTWGYRGGGAAYRENYFFPQAGRNFMVMLTLKF